MSFLKIFQGTVSYGSEKGGGLGEVCDLWEGVCLLPDVTDACLEGEYNVSKKPDRYN